MFKKLSYATLALVASVGIASSAGFWWGWPILGNSGYCIGFVNGVCTQTAPAGEATITGNELIPADTQLPGGQGPQSEYVPLVAIANNGQGAFKNALIGSDFSTNLWQRGTTFSSLSPTTTTMTADRFGVYSSGNVVTIARDTTAADLSSSTGINAAMKITRPSGTNTTAICVGQVLPQKDSLRFLTASNGATGGQVVFSFYASPLAGYLATNKDIIANIAVYTATDNATPGTNTDAFMKGTIAGYTVINPTSTTVATAPVIPLATGWNRYSVTGVVPATVSTNAVTGIGITICTPVFPASTGVSTDGFLLANLQLEQGHAANTANAQPAYVTPSSFSRRLPADEASEQLTYSYVVTDGAITRVYGWCQETTANTSADCIMKFPQEMREVPTTTVSAAGWSIEQTNATNETCSALAGVASSNTIDAAELLCTAGGTIALGAMSPFLGGASAGPSTITYSAEP